MPAARQPLQGWIIPAVIDKAKYQPSLWILFPFAHCLYSSAVVAFHSYSKNEKVPDSISGEGIFFAISCAL
jgi:hypothetical protein